MTQIANVAAERDRYKAEAERLREACEEMLHTLESPSRQLLDSTRRELDPWKPMLKAALAAPADQEVKHDRE